MKLLNLLIISVLLFGCFGADSQRTGREGKPMPDFNILLTDSTTWLNPSKIFNDKPISLFYFSPYCPFCKAQTEEIIEDIEKLKGIKFYFISRFPMISIKEFERKYNLQKYPNISTGMDTSSMVQDYFEMTGVPYMAIYNKNKILNKTFMGKIYSSQIKKVSEE